MRKITCQAITDKIATLFQDACIYLPEDVTDAIKRARRREKSPLGKYALQTMIDSIDIAALEHMPLCQDTGTSVVFLEIGQDVQITGGDIHEAVDEGVRKGYDTGYLRKSMVNHPFSARCNTNDNTPAVIHIDMVPGNKIKIITLPKGGGSENCSRLTVLPPSKGYTGIVESVIDVVDQCGGNACPPLVIGVGIGGTSEKTMLLAKKALLRKVGSHNPDREASRMEKDILAGVNALGIGPMGYGGIVTALAVHIEVFPSHIASLPVAVNLQCWCSRHKEAVI
jgi:fumarate hydratase subunit alpha